MFFYGGNEIKPTNCCWFIDGHNIGLHLYNSSYLWGCSLCLWSQIKTLYDSDHVCSWALVSPQCYLKPPNDSECLKLMYKTEVKAEYCRVKVNFREGSQHPSRITSNIWAYDHSRDATKQTDLSLRHGFDVYVLFTIWSFFYIISSFAFWLHYLIYLELLFR